MAANIFHLVAWVNFYAFAQAQKAKELSSLTSSAAAQLVSSLT